jgi:hypothetical protein
MSPRYIMVAFAIFIIGTILSVICSGVWLGSNEVDIVKGLASFNTMEVQAGGGWNAPKTLKTYWDAMITCLTWNYPFLSSSWAWFVKVPLIVVSVGVVWGIIQLFTSIIQGLVGFVRNLI